MPPGPAGLQFLFLPGHLENNAMFAAEMDELPPIVAGAGFDSNQQNRPAAGDLDAA